MTNDYQISIFTTDTNLIVRSWDRWLAEVTKLAAENVCGKPLSAIVPDLESRGLLARFQRVISEGAIETLAPAFHHYLIPCLPEEPSKYFDKMQQRVTITPWRENEQIIGTIVAIEDVTARLEIERDRSSQSTTTSEPSNEQPSLSQKDSKLLNALGDENWRVRSRAVDSLARQSDPVKTASLLRSLRNEHRNISVLNSVLQVLAISDTDIIAPLIQCLNDEDIELRVYAALALGEQQNPRAIPALLKALEDADMNVRYHAIDALGHLRATEAVEELTKIAQSRDFFLAFAAIESLKRIGDSTLASRLVPLLTDRMLGESAATFLGQFGDAEIVPEVAELLNLPDAPTNTIAPTLYNIYQRYEKTYREGSYVADLAKNTINSTGTQNLLEALQVATTDELQTLVVILGWLEGLAVEQALTRLLNHPIVRKSVIDALARYGHRVTGLLIEQLNAQELETRLAAVVALGRIGDYQAVTALSELLTGDTELVIAAAGALAQIGDRRAFNPLLQLIGHPEAGVRQAAIAALDSLGHPEMPTRLISLLRDRNPYVRESAVRIAGYFAFSECVELLFECCYDEDERVRRAAIEHLPYLEHARVVPTLAEALCSLQTKVRAAAARAFSHIDGKLAFSYLVKALDDTDPWVRYYAVRAIGRHRYPEAIDLLGKLIRKDPANQVQAAAIEVLGQIGGARAVTILVPLAELENVEDDLSRTAVIALGQIGHPDALPPLLNVLQSPHPTRRIEALLALGVRGRTDVADTLQWTAATDTDPSVVQAAIDALVHVGTPEAITALIELAAEPARYDDCVIALAQLGESAIDRIAQGLTHPQAQVRKAVVEALMRLKHTQASEILIAALEDQESSVRLATIKALGHLGNRNAEQKIATMARTDPDTAVRRAAQKMLQK